MKIKGFRENPLDVHVRAMNLQTFDVSLEFVLNGKVCDFEFGRTAYDFVQIETSLLSFELLGQSGNRWHLAWLNVQNGKGRKQFYGFLVYSSAIGLIDFLVSKYIPSGNTPIDKFLKGEKKSKAKLNKLYKMLFDENGHPKDKTVQYSVPAISSYILENGINTLECIDRKGKYLLRKMRHHPGRIFYLEEKLVIDNTPIPVFKFFVHSGWEHPIFYWNGQRLEYFFASGIGELQQKIGIAVWEEFEREGRCIKDNSVQWLISQEFTPEVIIRIPSLKEAQPYLEKGFSKLKKSKECPQPLYVADICSNIRLSENMRLVKTVPEALSIISRTMDNVYVPKDAPVDPSPFLRKNESFLIGVRPYE